MALKVLIALDHAKTQYYHFKAIMIAGMGLFTDAYGLFSITPVTYLIGRIYYTKEGDTAPGTVKTSVNAAMVAVALLGTVVGQLLFGVLGDRIGRKRVYGFSLLLMVFASFGCGFSICRTTKCVLTSLGFFRFLLGVGIGGDYPLSATIMSEFANKRTRGSFIAAVFSMQGFGILTSSTVTMVVARVFEKATPSKEFVDPVVKGKIRTPESADLAWRIILMMGAIPAGLTYHWRRGMPETARFTALVEKDVTKANEDMKRVLPDAELYPIAEDKEDLHQLPPPQTYTLFSKQFLHHHGRHLFACAISWLIVDIPFYGTNLLTPKIFASQINSQEVNAFEEAYNVARIQAIIAIMSTIPGYWFTIYFIDRIGRRKIQMLGFSFMALFLVALGAPYDLHWHDHIGWGFFVLYGFIFFFSNFGPNTTTFIVPAELFPARFRSTCHGVAGAAGKVGAIVGAVGLLLATRDGNRYLMHALLILAGICVVGLVVTHAYTPETMGKSLEENEGGGGIQEGDVEVNS